MNEFLQSTEGAEEYKYLRKTWDDVRVMQAEVPRTKADMITLLNTWGESVVTTTYYKNDEVFLNNRSKVTEIEKGEA